ncbi:MAG TPA: rhodanese-like domain-containing protein [Salinivirga sp.]|uniref:Thiosulfate sulfurtransferase GlpE n=1 Tax=Salinivirga cyanobacteriivorans TaxID=1307839 RepID=A0A0S2I1B5_9BACT|nr:MULTISPECIES: rhodanese-like domain-containing protein [Salinivirga]ALO16084.1 Thiosulfate sulfurtransferase GlpE [Salinivirga cyanobacteriivorans]HKK58315.1 rhodanese-like domain-containing protein [Salinivirga sp.]
MKKLFIFILIIAAFAACQTENKSKDNSAESADRFSIVMSYLESNGNYINSASIPSIISAKKLYGLLDRNTLVIDIRKEPHYQDGHIAGAVNVKYSNLLNYFEKNIDPASFDVIAIACYSGQSAGFATSLLRLLGYDNVYSLKWGMSSWKKKFADMKWSKKTSNKYLDAITTESKPKAEFGEYPKIMSEDSMAYNIIRKRAHKMFKNGFRHYAVKNNVLFEQPESFYIINYWPEKFYKKGHIPGAIQYTPKKSLDRASYLQTLPVDKPVVPYCFTGQHSAYVTAYLALIGYEARTLLYGANGFMHDMLVNEIGHAFTEKQVMDYPTSKDQSQTRPKAKKEEKSESTVSVSGGC